MILVAGVVCLAVAAAGAYALRERQIRHQLNVARAEGMAAYRAHDWATAIDKLGPYVSRRPDDADAVFGLAIAHTQRHGADSSDIDDAIGYLRRYREMAPANTDAQDRLLDLLRQTRAWDQVIDMSRQMLLTNPHELVALADLAVALQASGKSPEALRTAEAYNEANPTDLDGHELTYVIMAAMKLPAQQMLDRARQFEARFPNDARFKLAEVIAYTLGREASLSKADDAQAASTARQLEESEVAALLAATHNVQPPDAQFVRQAVRLLDLIHRYDEALSLLSRAAAQFGGDPQIRLMYAQRLWEAGQNDKVAQFLSDSTGAATEDASLAAYKALALENLNQGAAAATLIAALAQRTDDPSAQAWSTALAAQDNANLRQKLDGLQKAVAADPSNGVIHFFLASAYCDAEESDLALEQARIAAASMPSWMDPHLLCAKILTERGDATEAIAESDNAMQAAVVSNHGADDAAIIKATAFFTFAESHGDASAFDTLITQLEEFRQSHPDDRRTLAIYVRLLAQTNQTAKAKEVITSAIADAGKDSSPDILLDLARVCRLENLDMQQPLFDAAREHFGVAPQLAFDQATFRTSSGAMTPADALKYLRDSAAAGKGQPWEWELVIARFLEDAHDAGAGAAWVNLGNTYPNNLTVQRDILDPSVAPSAWSGEQPFIAATVERLRQLTGEQALNWKIAKARWLLASSQTATGNTPSATKDAANEASVLLNDVLRHTTAAQRFEPHMLQSQAMERLGNTDGAVSEMSQAWLLAPSSGPIGFDLLRLYHAAGRYADATDVFDHLIELPLSDDLRQRSAAIMYDQSEFARAADSLASAGKTPATIGLMAMADQRLGKIKDAGDLYLGLLDAKDVPAMVISSAADYFASVGDTATAEKFLAKLDTAGLADWDRMLKQAAYLERYGNDPAAVKQLYLNAMAADQTDAGPAARYAAYLIRRQDLTGAAAVLNTALKSWPDNADLRGLHTLSEGLASPAMKAELTPVAALLTIMPGDPAAAELMSALAIPDHSQGDTQLQELLKKYPNFYPLYEVTVRRLIASRRNDAVIRAVELAEQAMDKFSDQPAAAGLACIAQAEAGHWAEALDAAQMWHQRDFQQPQEADWHIALCLINLGRTNEAINRLEAYVVDATGQANQPPWTQILRTYCAALLAAGRTDDAQATLTPLATTSAQWRGIWLDLAKDASPDANQAAAWIGRVVPLIPPGDKAETRVLAQTWFDVAARRGYQKGFENCRDLLMPISGQLDASGLLLLAMAEDQSHDARAAGDYRCVMTAATRPSSGAAAAENTRAAAAAANNLANLEMSNGDAASLTDAEALAKRAIAAASDDPGAVPFYYDTLARVYLREGKPDDAANQFAQADRIRPNDAAILIGWADSLVQANKMDEAVVKLQAAEARLPVGGQLTPELAKELQTVRDTVQKALPPA
ncbi:MAG: tetratricopeptide repeat protein [Tepidisphaeraceae bacterium]|jgi:predicted Zn-dependent protease